MYISYIYVVYILQYLILQKFTYFIVYIVSFALSPRPAYVSRETIIVYHCSYCFPRAKKAS